MVIRELNKKDYTVGQEVALRYYGNAARGNKDNDYRITEITKVGNKIIYCGDIKISMETGMEKSNYTPNYIFYDSEQHLIETLECERLLKMIRNKIGQWGDSELSLYEIREIANILGLS